MEGGKPGLDPPCLSFLPPSYRMALPSDLRFLPPPSSEPSGVSCLPFSFLPPISCLCVHSLRPLSNPRAQPGAVWSP